MKKAEPKNHKKKWTLEDYAILEEYLSEDLSLSEVAKKLGRTEISSNKALKKLKNIVEETKKLQTFNISNFPAIQKTIQDTQLNTAIHRSNIAEALKHNNINNINNELNKISSIYSNAVATLSDIKLPKIQIPTNIGIATIQNLAEKFTLSNHQYTKLIQELNQNSSLQKALEFQNKIDFTWNNPSINEIFNSDAFVKTLEAIGNQSSISLAYDNISLSKISKNPIARFLQHEMTQVSSRYSALMSSINSIEKVLSLPKVSIPWAYEEMVLNAHTYHTFVDPNHDIFFPLETDISQEHISLETTQRNLEGFNPALGIVHSGIIQSFGTTNPDKTRHIFVGLRTIWEQVLTEIAPKKETMSWLADRNYLSDEYLYIANGEKKPTRWAKLCYVFRHVQSPELLNFVEAQIKMVIDLIKMINRLHDINTRYADDEIKIVLSQNSSCLNFIFDIGINSKK